MQNENIYNLLSMAVLAIFGVSARELRYKDEKKFKVARLFGNMFVATFGAVIVHLVFSLTEFPEQIGYIVAGLVGWGGPEVVDKIFEKHTDYMSSDKK